MNQCESTMDGIGCRRPEGHSGAHKAEVFAGEISWTDDQADKLSSAEMLEELNK
jgi:hypothetical protein